MASKKNLLSKSTKMMFIAILSIVAMGYAISYGADSGSLDLSWSLLGYYCAVFVPLTIGGLIVDIRKKSPVRQRQLTNRIQLHGIADKYNQVISLLEQSFKDEKKSLREQRKLTAVKEEELRAHYEDLYKKNSEAYHQERKIYLNSDTANPAGSRTFSRFWKWLTTIGVLTQLVTCSYSFGTMVGQDEGTESVTYWNADNIPIPYLTDDTRYVSNPDNVVSENTEQLLNQWYKKLEDSLGIQSVVVVVNHVENDDPFRMAQDIGNKYGVGYEDRGLVIILAYEDHAINISPGKSLEADLTDYECKMLQQQYVIPCMREEQPDSGMLYLAEAIYSTLQKKDMPPTPTLDSFESSDEDDFDGIIFIYMVLFGGWMILIGYLYNLYHGPQGTYLLHANPFEKPAEPQFVAGPSTYHSRGRSFGGGGFSGGSRGGHFGGGSFGGGGATSRW